MDFEDALANEFKRGMAPIGQGETLDGASKFAGGVGRHGDFDKKEPETDNR